MHRLPDSLTQLRPVLIGNLYGESFHRTVVRFLLWAIGITLATFALVAVFAVIVLTPASLVASDASELLKGAVPVVLAVLLLGSAMMRGDALVRANGYQWHFLRLGAVSFFLTLAYSTAFAAIAAGQSLFLIGFIVGIAIGMFLYYFPNPSSQAWRGATFIVVVAVMAVGGNSTSGYAGADVLESMRRGHSARVIQQVGGTRLEDASTC